QQQLQAITDNLPAMIGYLDREGHYRFVNDAYEKAYGTSRAEIAGMHYMELLGEAAAAELKPNLDRAFAGEAVSVDISRHYRETGNRHMEFQFRPDFDDAGDVRGVYILGNDITDRKADETALKKSEARLREAQRVALLAKWDRDLVDDTLTVSDNLYDIFGVTPETFSPSLASLLSLVHPEDRELVQSYSQGRAKGAEKFKYDYRCVRPDGSVIHLETRSEPIFNEVGTVIARHGTIQDVSAQKAAADALRISEARLAQAQTLAKIGSWYRAGISGALEYSEEMFHLLGVNKDTYRLTTDAYVELMHPDDRDTIHQYSFAAADKPDDYQYVHRIICPDGAIRYMEHRSSAIIDDHGIVIARSGTTQDITEQKRVETEKQEVEARLSEARRRAGLCSWQWDMNSGDVTWSEEAQAVLGLRPKDTVPDHATYFTMVHPDDQHILVEAEKNAASATGTHEYEYRFMSPDGKMRYLQDVATTTRDSDGTVTYSSGTIRDITTEKAAEQRLRQVESRFSLARRHIGIGFWEWTVDTGKVMWSDEAQLIYGFEPGTVEASHDLFYQHIHPDDLEKFRAAEQEAIKGQKNIYESEYRWITPAGETKHFYGAGVITYDSNGQASIATGIVQDITGRKLAEQRLRDSENRLALAQKQAHIGNTHRIIATNEATWSDEIYEIMGRDPDTYDPSTEDILDLFHPDDRQQFNTYFDTATANEEQYGIDIRIVRPDGEIREVHLQSGPGYDEDGIYSFRRGTVQDVTDRKQAERAVVESERLHRSILDNMVDTFFRFDTEGRIVMASLSAETLLGYTLAELKGQKLSALHKNVEERDHFLMQMRDSPTGVRGFEAEMIAKDGRSVWVSTNARHWVDAEGNILGIEGTVRDITEEREVSEQLRQAQKMEAVGQLTGGVAHDFNNMLAVVMGNIELAIDSTDEGSRTNTLLRNTLTRTERGAELVKRLLAFSRKQALAPSVVQLDDIVQSMTSTFGQMLGETTQVVTRSIDGLWPCKVDRSEIENALLNLIINARDAMPNGGMITVTSTNATLDNEGAAAVEMVPGDYSAVTVTDVGTGMTADVLDRVFEPFYTTKGVGEGTGLGLPMVYGFVKQSGGGIRIETDPGEGTSITLYLPRASGPLTMPTSAEAQPTEGNSGQTVLVVEDDKAVRAIAVSMISGMGYKFIEAENAAQAMQVLGGNERIDVLFTDVIMPGEMRGPQLAVEAQKIRPELKVILTTGYNDIVDIDAQSEGHEFGLLRKPYRRVALAKALSDMLASEPS
ncbi:MAG: PAS domain S-box protein, partial [Alphaproteobacteria bacterium]|nr:PAS domain S-box protein [Alphaproteobacteria bacterium]